MTNDLIAKKLILASFFQFFSGTQTDFMMSSKEKFLLTALMKQKHKTIVAQRKLDMQKEKKAKTIRYIKPNGKENHGL